MRIRTILAAGFCISLITSSIACSDGGGRTSSGGDGGDGGEGGREASSSSSATSSGSGTGGSGQGGEAQGGAAQGGGGAGQGGEAQGGAGQGGEAQGGAGQGGIGQGGVGQGGIGQGGIGQGGIGQGGAGQGGAAMAAEDCDNTTDDDADMMTDCADSDCAGSAVCGKLLLNEIDYDQANADTAEFIEILNAGATDVDLSGVRLIYVNGSNSDKYGDIPLSGSLGAGKYLVLAMPGVVNIDPGATVVMFGAMDPPIQNGSPDAVALFDTAEKKVLDAISYEGSITAGLIDGVPYNLVSGTATLAADTAAPNFPVASIIRRPNGQDTDDDAADWSVTSILTPGAPNQQSPEVCDNMADDDFDTLTDCADMDCAAAPSCQPVEICTNGIDDEGDMMTDCADMDCDGQVCDAFGSVCVASACSCPGGPTEIVCDDNMDNNCDGAVDCADADCMMSAACMSQKVTGVNYPVITHGGKLVITGVGLMGATAVTIGGVAQMFTVDSDTQITIASVPDMTGVGPKDLVVTTPGGDTAAFPLTVIHLLIDELDSDQAGTDTAEFVEISTGVPGVSLAGYTLVFWNGSNNQAYRAIDMNATTDAAGRLLLGTAALMPAISWPDSTLQNAEEAIGVYQVAANTFVTTGAGATLVTANNLIDAVVYQSGEMAMPAMLLDTLFGPVGTPGRVIVDDPVDGSVQRCGDGRRDGSKFATGAPTPGVANSVPACP
jgi:hypothetical protein